MLTLIDLTQSEIDLIASRVPGGPANIREIYPLAPLQEGILFHHLMSAQGDAYLVSGLLAFDTRERLESFASALQMVIDRHDILRTAVLWEELPQPVQVVWRQALMPIEEVSLDPFEMADGDAARALRERFSSSRYRMDLRQAPLMRAVIAYDSASARWLFSRSPSATSSPKPAPWLGSASIDRGNRGNRGRTSTKPSSAEF
jgi:hypothetical protein